jgi:hypothetical protein
LQVVDVRQEVQSIVIGLNDTVHNDRVVIVGIEMFRLSVKGTPLPSARFISFNLFNDVSRPSLETTFLFVFFGQLTDHDLTRTAASLVPDPTAGRVHTYREFSVTTIN